jgi:RimJ/RimL family protein N-acetyltransferase
MRQIEPAELRGDRVTIKPLRKEHAMGLLGAADSEEVFTWLTFSRFTHLDQVQAWIAEALAERRSDRRLPFVVIETESESVIGSTSYRDLDKRNGHVEIGSTWFSRASWGMGANSESKLLLMAYAFETLYLERVVIRADNLNLRSQRATEKLGGVTEGIHRHEVLRRDGSWCDSIYYSILSSEWPEVESRIKTQLTRSRRSSSA